VTAAYEIELAEWRAARLTALVAEDGWLNLTDRVEIVGPGRWSVGSGEDADLRLSVGPERLGWLTIGSAGFASFRKPNGTHWTFQKFRGSPPRIRSKALHNLLLEIHTVEGNRSLRVRQINHPARMAFPGLQNFPTNPGWVVLARWEKLTDPVATRVDMVSGFTETVVQTHLARFNHAGSSLALIPTHWKGSQPMFVIRDATSGVETYGASRFLLGDVLDDKTIRLDFNRLHNPPCAFTDLAVCPLPPPGNILPFRIEAGELAP
jgi:uncharacterized protein